VCKYFYENVDGIQKWCIFARIYELAASVEKTVRKAMFDLHL